MIKLISVYVSIWYRYAVVQTRQSYWINQRSTTIAERRKSKNLLIVTIFMQLMIGRKYNKHIIIIALNADNNINLFCIACNLHTILLKSFNPDI